jgi:membrane protease subunit HflK
MDDKTKLTAEKPPLPPAGAKPAEAVSSAGMQALMRTLRVLFMGLRVLIIIIFVYLIFSGMFRVDEQNEAMLFRFGKLQRRVLDPERGESPILTSGRWYWAWPYPVDWVKEIPAQRSVTVSTETTFQPWMSANLPDQQADNFLRPGVDGYLLSGDTNIIHAKWDVNFRVVNAEKYYLDFFDVEEAEVVHNKAKASHGRRNRGTEATIRNLLSNAVLAETATWSVEDLLATTRNLPDGQAESLKDKVEERLVRLLAEVGLGVQVQSLNLVELQTPQATSEAFRRVNEASETGRAEMLKARSYAENVVLAAQGLAYRIVDEARSYRSSNVERVKADSSYFETVLSEYQRNPETMLTALYTDAVSEVLSKVKNKYVLHTLPEGQQELRLQIGAVPVQDGDGADAGEE